MKVGNFAGIGENTMIDTYGKWHEEKDCSTYSKEEWCDYDTMAAWIRECGYEPKTSMENLISIIFLHYDNKLDEDEGGSKNYG